MDKIKFNGKLNNFNVELYKKSKILYKFDYKVFKILLFLVWDIEFYLGRDIKNCIEIYEDPGIALSCFNFLLDKLEFRESIKLRPNFQ